MTNADMKKLNVTFDFVHTAGAGGSSNRSNNAGPRSSSSGKKRPISPEQVLKMFAAPNYNATSSYSKSQSPPPHGSNATQPHNTSSTIHNDNLTVRTISMSRPNATSGSPSNQGFGICVKGGADESSECISDEQNDSVPVDLAITTTYDSTRTIGGS